MLHEDERQSTDEVIEAFDPLSSIEYSQTDDAGSPSDFLTIYDFPPPPEEMKTSPVQATNHKKDSPNYSANQSENIDMNIFLEKITQIETHIQTLTEENEKLTSEQGLVHI